MLTHTNNCITKSVVESLSKMEEFPVALMKIDRRLATSLYRNKTKSYVSISRATWFKAHGIAVRVTTRNQVTVYEVMSFYNN